MRLKMSLKNIKNLILVVFLGFLLTACATSSRKPGKDYYTGSDTVKFLASGVPDRVFFATNRSSLHSGAKGTLNKQAAYIKSSGISVVVEGHADERGTREYNLALGEKRAQAVKNYLISLGISSDRVSTISYGKERPAVVGSNDGAWAQNRRSVTIVN